MGKCPALKDSPLWPLANEVFEYKEFVPQEDYPFARITVPLYPDLRLLEPVHFRVFKPELYTNQALNTMTKEKHQSWMMSHYIRWESEICAMDKEREEGTEIRGLGPQRVVRA